jgi:hypothetical protein
MSPICHRQRRRQAQPHAQFDDWMRGTPDQAVALVKRLSRFR